MLARAAAEGRRALRLGKRLLLPVGARDVLRNARWARADRRFLCLRHPTVTPDAYAGLLRWLAANFPDLRRRFELRLLPRPPIDPGRHALLVPWLLDPIEAWSPAAYRQACAVAARCAGAGIPVVNHPAALSNSAKSRTAALIGGLDLRTPRMVTLRGPDDLDRAAAVLAGPMLIRKDRGHQGPIRLVGDGERVVWSGIAATIPDPVAIEFIDTRGPDGLFRKYRYLAAGAHGISVHRLVSRHWEVRGGNKLADGPALAEEAAHVAAPDPNHSVLQAAREALGLDLVAFDYGHDAAGRLVVWEANPYPAVFFGAPSEATRYRLLPVHRSFAAMVGLYLDRAGLPVPGAIEALRSYDAPKEAAALAARLAVPGQSKAL